MSEPITKETVVEQIIKTYPKSLGYLVGKGVDCCCGAYNTLEKGAAEVGADLSVLLRDLNVIATDTELAAPPKGR